MMKRQTSARPHVWRVGGSTWVDLADLLVLGFAAPLTHSYIINAIIAPHDLHHNMEINIPPSRLHSLQTSLTPTTFTKE